MCPWRNSSTKRPDIEFFLGGNLFVPIVSAMGSHCCWHSLRWLWNGSIISKLLFTFVFVVNNFYYVDTGIICIPIREDSSRVPLGWSRFPLSYFLWAVTRTYGILNSHRKRNKIRPITSSITVIKKCLRPQQNVGKLWNSLPRFVAPPTSTAALTTDTLHAKRPSLHTAASRWRQAHRQEQTRHWQETHEERVIRGSSFFIMCSCMGLRFSLSNPLWILSIAKYLPLFPHLPYLLREFIAFVLGPTGIKNLASNSPTWVWSAQTVGAIMSGIWLCDSTQ